MLLGQPFDDEENIEDEPDEAAIPLVCAIAAI
jgi:hypothetical protein